MRRALAASTVFLVLLTACGSSGESGRDTAKDTSKTTTTLPVYESSAEDAIVRYAQDALAELGYYDGPSDGRLDTGVRSAIVRFQKAKDLDPTGRFDAPTVRAMVDASPVAAALLVSALQTQLTDLGFYTGAIDGKLASEGMTEAIRALQRRAGLTVDGVFGPASFDALQRLYSRSPDAEAPTTTTTSGPTTTTAVTAPTTAPSSGADGTVADAQRRLAALGYRPGPADGQAGYQTSSAVLAFQKREGLPRTSNLDARTLARLAAPTGAGPRSSAPGPRVEIDLDRQILFFIDEAGRVTTINTSTGNGERYNTSSGPAVAYTPTGSFRIERRIDGIRRAPLGSLYRPMYFKLGWAIHGAAVVPAYPASHGCARTANWDQDFLFPRLPDGSPVVIYGTSIGAPGGGQPGY